MIILSYRLPIISASILTTVFPGRVLKSRGQQAGTSKKLLGELNP